MKNVLFAILLIGIGAAKTPAEQPNIILIFTDDQGYLDLGCFGAQNIKTPHLDRMAAEGVRLTSFYAQPVCGVSRAALMTGSYPIRIAEPGNQKRLHTVPHPKETTMAEVLKKAGYATGMIGKWHLAIDRKDLPTGVGPATMPNAQGFDYFYGTPKYNGFTVYVGDHPMRSSIMRNQEVVVEAVESWDNITADYTTEAIKWIKSNTKANPNKPFFLYLAHNMPHIPLGASEKFKGKSAGGFYGDTIEEIDWSCGEVLKTLKELNIDDNTLVVFTSDNGPWVETTKGMESDGEAFIPRDHSGNADPYRGWKMSAWDGGSRVPFIARWPRRIPAGWESDEMLSTMDLLPTFASIAGAALPDAGLDGKVATEFLTRATKTSPRDEYLYYSGCLLTGVRSGKWKLVLPRKKAPQGLGWWGRMIEAVSETMLFNLADDPGETINVASDNPDVVASLMKRIERARSELGDIDRTGSGARFFDKGQRRLQYPIREKPAESDAALVDPAKLYRDTIPEEKNLDPIWLQSLTERGHQLDRGIRGSNADDTLKYIGMPVGGVGCGTVYLNGDGRLYVWDIWNKGQRGVIAQDIDVPEGFPNFRDKPKVDVVNGSNFLNPPTFEKFPPNFAQGFGLKMADGSMRSFRQSDWKTVEFTGNWPMGTIRYQDSNSPISAKLKAYSPFVPLDLDASTIPVTVMRYTLTNDSDKPVSSELVGWMANASNTPQSRSLGYFKARPNLTTVHHECKMKVPPFIQGKRKIEPDKPFHEGSMTLSLLGEGTSTSVDDAPGIASDVMLNPGESRELTFLISWHFPDVRIREEFGPETVPMKNAYARRFDDSLEVANHVAMNRNRLFGDTELWVKTWNDSTLPQWLLDRTMATADTLQTANCFILDDNSDDGRFWAWEGVGVCHGTCTHVWYYAQTMARLFPSLERNLREKTDFELAMLPDGGVPFRIGLGRGSKVAIDGQCGTVLRSYREHLTSADSTFLKTNWPNIKRAAEYLINFDRNDGDFDGLLDGEQHNTLDAEWYGKVHALTSPYLATLRACEKMARQVGDTDFEILCQSTYEKGSKNIDKLFNGEYYVQLEDPNHPEAIGVGKGVYIDQVIGQFWANQLGLGRLYSEDHIKSALRSIWTHNFVPDVARFREKFREGRFYAWDGDAGLLMCTWPGGGLRDDFTKHWQYAYFNESMTGFEYQAAAHMVAERDPDLVTKGLAIARSIHDRYSPTKRNPYNEIECSDHYSRAMSSYAVFLAACGFHYDGPGKAIGFDPVIQPQDFRAPFTAAKGWGTFEQKMANGSMTAELRVNWGEVSIQTLRLSSTLADTEEFTVTYAGQKLTANVLAGKNGTEITLSQPVDVSAGEALKVVL
jgi:non-lysosomal glucosylceramidase